MSGFAIAEAVLGVFPPVVSALENYKNGVQALKKWNKYKENIQCLIRNINVERARLQNVCEKLLDGLVPPSEIDAMVENPSGDLWMNEEIQKKIRARLWRSWAVFEQTLKDIQVAINEMSEKIGNGSDVSHHSIILFDSPKAYIMASDTTVKYIFGSKRAYIFGEKRCHISIKQRAQTCRVSSSSIKI